VIAVAEVSSHRCGLMEFGRGNGLQIRDWMNRKGTLRGMVLQVNKHSKNPQSRTEMHYVDEACAPWYLSIEVPDPALALFLTWHKAGMDMPRELIEASRRKLEVRRLRGTRGEKDRYREEV
jgi:hypothetical protein